MADVVDAETRSRMMAGIRGRDTKPELIVRRVLHRLGFRFRLHRRDLPGSPDIVLPRHRTVVLVHGCFWHVHSCSKGRVKPKTRAEFWENKRQGNVRRDRRVVRRLRRDTWHVITVWECQTQDVDRLASRLEHALGSPRRPLRRTSPAASEE